MHKGHADAQIDLGMMHLSKNRTTAYMWVSIAASLGGKDGAKALKVVEGFMTPADISALQTIARECIRNS
jgi:TPR repeat protein